MSKCIFCCGLFLKPKRSWRLHDLEERNSAAKCFAIPSTSQVSSNFLRCPAPVFKNAPRANAHSISQLQFHIAQRQGDTEKFRCWGLLFCSGGSCLTWLFALAGMILPQSSGTYCLIQVSCKHVCAQKTSRKLVAGHVWLASAPLCSLAQVTCWHIVTYLFDRISWKFTRVAATKVAATKNVAAGPGSLDAK